MKNLTKPVGDLYPHIKKLTLIMRLSVLLILIAVFTSTASVYSQATRLTVKMENARLSEVFDAIEKQSEFYFFYNRDYFNDDRIVSVDVENKLVDEVLKELFKGEKLPMKFLTGISCSEFRKRL
jgi:TonB-dependent starch-binding outer membrane protein SusC